jgi:hypothetical protein
MTLHSKAGTIALLMSAGCFAGEQQATAPATAPAPAPSGAGVIVFSSDRDGDYELYRINPDGSGLAQLTDNALKDTAPAWSPDGGSTGGSMTFDIESLWQHPCKTCFKDNTSHQALNHFTSSMT